MRSWLTKLLPGPWLLRKILVLAALIGVGAAAFCWGRWQNAVANPPQGGPYQPHPVAATPGFNTAEQGTRVVAYVYNNVPVYREELGEYLIARFGGDRLEFMIHRKIVETEYAKLNFQPVTDAEVEARFRRDLNSFGQPLTQQDFVNNILRRFGKTLYEWKEDVIRPKLMMEKIVRPLVERSLSDKDLREGFEARYGAKVECRMIVYDTKGNPRHIQTMWDEARKSREAFLKQAREQFIPNLASIEGKVPAIHRNFGDAQLEETAFRLKEGEVSSLIQLKDGTVVVLLCEKHLPADASRRFEDERMKLAQEMLELRLAQKIPEVFKEMRERANPQLMLRATNQPQMVSHIAPPPAVQNPAPVAKDGPAVPVAPPNTSPSPAPQPVNNNSALPQAPGVPVIPSLSPPPLVPQKQ